MAGENAVRFTSRAALLAPSTVTTRFAELFDFSSIGTIRLICVSLLNRIVAASPSKVAPTILPANPEPVTVVSEPGTAGVAAKLAAFIVLTMVGFGVAGVAAFTVNVT